MSIYAASAVVFVKPVALSSIVAMRPTVLMPFVTLYWIYIGNLMSEYKKARSAEQ